MWASCCGLLNEVMGTGTVRAQQPGFGAGAGPFRFAPSAGYSTYPPTSSGSAGQLCKACGLAFSVFRRKVNIRFMEEGLSKEHTSIFFSLLNANLIHCALQEKLPGFTPCQCDMKITLQRLA